MSYILIVDDDRDFSEAIAKILEKNNYEITLKHDVDSGLKSFQERKPDLAILDVMFPESATAGFDLARKVYEKPEYKDIPLIMLTAVNQEFPLGFSSKDIDNTWMPVHEFIEKPVDFDVLLEKIASLLKK